jgi:hypothetical protein
MKDLQGWQVAARPESDGPPSASERVRGMIVGVMVIVRVGCRSACFFNGAVGPILESAFLGAASQPHGT